MTVYFIKPVGSDGPVKIGYSRNPQERLNTLTLKRRPFELAATIDGDCRVERQFHAMFRRDHIGKEWFFSTDEMVATIQSIQDGTFDPNQLPEPVRLPRKAIEYTPERRAHMSKMAKKHWEWRREYRARVAKA